MQKNKKTSDFELLNNNPSSGNHGAKESDILSEGWMDDWIDNSPAVS